ncbi:hypothetical protein [Mycobacterium sp.]
MSARAVQSGLGLTPIIGCAAKVALGIGAAVMEWLAGPVQALES